MSISKPFCRPAISRYARFPCLHFGVRPGAEKNVNPPIVSSDCSRLPPGHRHGIGAHRRKADKTRQPPIQLISKTVNDEWKGPERPEPEVPESLFERAWQCIPRNIKDFDALPYGAVSRTMLAFRLLWSITVRRTPFFGGVVLKTSPNRSGSSTSLRFI